MDTSATVNINPHDDKINSYNNKQWIKETSW